MEKNKSTKVTMNNGVVVFTRPAEYEMDIEDLANNVEDGGLYEALSLNKGGGEFANDFIENNREELLVMIAKYWLETYDK
jgi:hypothetical protein